MIILTEVIYFLWLNFQNKTLSVFNIAIMQPIYVFVFHYRLHFLFVLISFKFMLLSINIVVFLKFSSNYYFISYYFS